jgi:Spy/CpxP family protein refolding chaperone
MEGVTEMRMLSEQLNLTPEQKEKLRPIVTEEGDQLHDVRRDQRLRPEQKNAKLLAIREEFAPKIGAVLTPEQQEKWKKIVETWHSKASEGAKDSTAPATPQ